MNYGFVIDTRSCIGCHACSTACKSENQVPLGVSRTWVKYTEVGVYPDVKRHFQVTRCNHCNNPPCARICPVTAMYQRDDGIVEFDSEQCIGCKACMQACPYDAIYIDPDSGTAAKCHFCGHRVENGVEPACVVVCPTHSIIAGDMDDPTSEISQVLAKNAVTVRKPEQGTAPKLFYVEGHASSMHPTAGQRTPDQMIWSDTVPLHGEDAGAAYPDAAEVVLNIPSLTETVQGKGQAHNGTPIRISQAQGDPVGGPIQVSPERMAEHMVQTVYNAQHKVPWHWQVPAYLVTKGIGAGLFMLLSAGALGAFELSAEAAMAGGILGLVALLATTALLVADLEKPERFLRILLRPNMKSWLTRGAFILVAFSNLALVWTALETAVAFGWMDPLSSLVRMVFGALTLPLGIGAAVYTAFLFGQAEGRDFWQSPLLPVHLLVQALMMGCASLALLGLGMDLGPELTALSRWGFLGALVVDLFVILAGEFGVPHASEQAARAAHSITKGRYSSWFWGGAMVLGHAIPAVLLLIPSGITAALAALAAIAGLYAYEHAFVMAPQDLPNS